MDSGNAPYVSLATSSPSQLLSTFAFLHPSSISTLIKMLHTTMTPCLLFALPDYPLPKNQTKIKKLSKNHSNLTKKKNLLPNTATCIVAPHPHARLFMTGLSLRPKFST
jgi:hypothetical protein